MSNSMQGHQIAKFESYGDGDDDYVPKDEQVWCLVTVFCGDRASLCTSSFIDEGAAEEGTKVTVKTVKRGGITCPYCLDNLKFFQEIRL